jgi:hypothetical protein
LKVHYTEHAQHVIAERGIKLGWVRRALESPERRGHAPDGTERYLIRIPEHGDRVLRVVVNPKARPPRVVTAFFDRRMKGRLT